MELDVIEAGAPRLAIFSNYSMPHVSVHPTKVDVQLSGGEEIKLGETVIEVISTPGHSPGSVTFLYEEDAIAGDVLFAGSIGRTDLPKGDLPTLLRTIDEVVIPLGDFVRIHPGHGPSTTVGEEMRRNPFLNPELREQILRMG